MVSSNSGNTILLPSVSVTTLMLAFVGIGILPTVYLTPLLILTSSYNNSAPRLVALKTLNVAPNLFFK
ncbi:MAG: hypothetical protein H0X49_14530 [Acidobacteria bacterium]|nr:hypothetical protein [Acidobacteriota bacterium]